jgi:hypothetical protein
MAARLNCMARPDEAFGPQASGAGTSSARGPTSSIQISIHYGAATATTPGHFGSRSRSRSTSRTGSRALSRGKAIQSSEGSEESDRQGDSEDEDPSFQVLRMSQMFDAPPATQTQGESSQVSMRNSNHITCTEHWSSICFEYFTFAIQGPRDAPRDSGNASPPRRRQRRVRDHTDVGSGNVLPTAPRRQRRRNDPFSPVEQQRRRR